MSQPVSAITFDFWDTIVVDDSDDAKRVAQGLGPKFEDRPKVIHQAIAKHHDIPFDRVLLAHHTTTAAFNKVWHDQFVTWKVADRLDVLLGGLKISLQEPTLAELIRQLEEMELEIRPDPIAGAHEAIRELAGKYKLGIISDAIYSPGRVLREILKREGLYDCFSAFVYSDEVGRSKPDPRVFDSAVEQLGVPISEIVHIGDRDHNDVKGPHKMGARAVLFTASKDKDKNTTTADAICERYADLPGVIASLDLR